MLCFQAIEDDTIFQMWLDDLRFWGFLGKLEKHATLTPSSIQYRHSVFTEYIFDISYNKDRVVEVKLTTDPFQKVLLSLAHLCMPLLTPHADEWYRQDHDDHVNRVFKQI